jgi:hypothetical protein
MLWLIAAQVEGGRWGAAPQRDRKGEMDDLMHKVEQLLRFSSDLESRMSETGLGGVGGVIDHFVRLRQALERVRIDELEWARAELRMLVELLTGVAEHVEQLHEVKLALAGSRILSPAVQPNGAANPA